MTTPDARAEVERLTAENAALRAEKMAHWKTGQMDAIEVQRLRAEIERMIINRRIIEGELEAARTDLAAAGEDSARLEAELNEARNFIASAVAATAARAADEGDDE